MWKPSKEPRTAIIIYSSPVPIVVTGEKYGEEPSAENLPKDTVFRHDTTMVFPVEPTPQFNLSRLDMGIFFPEIRSDSPEGSNR